MILIPDTNKNASHLQLNRIQASLPAPQRTPSISTNNEVGRCRISDYWRCLLRTLVLAGYMNTIRDYRCKPVALLLAVLLLRAAIPVGFMPAALGSGMLVVFCPDGVSTEFMQFLSGEGGGNHAHLEHGNAGDDPHQCPIGHMLLSAAATDSGSATAEVASPPPPTAATPYRFVSISRPHYYSRGPPA